MLKGRPVRGSVKKVVVFFLVAALLAGGGFVAYKKTKPKWQDPRINVNAVQVPPAGIAPFDPKPLMDKVNERLKADKFRFAVLGDSKHAKTLPGFLKYLDETVNPDFVLGTGDMVYKGGGEAGPGYYEMLEKEAGPSMRSRPWWPAIGNHEVSGNPVITGQKSEGAQISRNNRSGTENFKLFYNLPCEYYSFTCRNCYFIALPFPQPSGDQLVWLEKELKTASDQKKHIFIFNHVPYFTLGVKKSDDVPNTETNVTALFKKYGVAAVFSGHDHGYYRTVRSGIPYFISAGGGATINPANRGKEALPQDVYYFGVPETFAKTESDKRFVLHHGDGTPDKITEVPDQFLCYIDVDGDKINLTTVSVKGDEWDKIQLSK